jgi:YtxH-like protein
MSYAGPASRRKRTDDTRLVALRASSDAVSASIARPRPPAPKRTSDHGRTVAFALGIAVGMAFGAGVALLFAPQSGADARHTIARKGKRIRKRSRDAWDDLRDELHDAVGRRRLARKCRKLPDRNAS